MNDVYLTIAEGFEKLAAGYRALAGETPVQEAAPAVANPEPAPAEKPSKQLTIEEVRAVLAEKSEAGKQMEVKNLLFKYDSGKLSGVKPEDYASLLAEAEAL
jgi:hypothetical protein